MANNSTLLMVQLSEHVEPAPVVPDTDGGGKGSDPGAGSQGFYTTQAENTQQTTQTINSAIPVAFIGLAFFILTFIILSIIKKRRESFPLYRSNTRLTKLQVLSATAASVFLVAVFNPAIFGYTVLGPIDTDVSKKLTINADIIGTDNIAYIKDTITIPASEYGYKLYITTDDSNDNYLYGDSTEGIINPISTEGPLADNTYGFSFEDPTLPTTTFYPVQEKSSRESVLELTPEKTTEEQHIDIWYAVRSKASPEDVYRTNIEYETIGEQDANLEDMTAEICASLQEGTLDYEFTNSLGETQFVSKLEDGNCWTKPVPPEDPETQPAFSCPTNWHDATNYDYAELDLFYNVKNPETTANPIIVGYDKTTEHPEGSCIADFNTATVTFDSNGVEVSNLPDPMHIPNDEVTITDFIYTITTPAALETDATCQSFLGWSLLPDAITPLYEARASATFSSPNVTLYAVWGNAKTPKAILDSSGLLNFVYDYCSVSDLEDENNAAGRNYRAAYEAEHNAEITNIYLVRGDATDYRMVPWTDYNSGNDNIVNVNFENSFINYEPKSTCYWFYGLHFLNNITNLENLNTSKTLNMEAMFYNSAIESITIPNNFGHTTTNMRYMFKNTSSLASIELPEEFGKQATEMEEMFYKSAIESITIPNDIEHPENNFGYAATNMRDMFRDTSSLASIELPKEFGKQAINMEAMFMGSAIRSITIPNDTENLENVFGYAAKNMKYMFRNTSSLVSIELPEGFGYSAENTAGMFEFYNKTTPISSGLVDTYCRIDSSLTSIHLPLHFGQESADMTSMFHCAYALTSLDLPSGFGRKATQMNFMFLSTRALANLSIPNDTDRRNNFGNAATTMEDMFAYSAIVSLDFPNGFGSAATNMKGLSFNNTKLSSVTLPPDFGSVATDMMAMFRGAKFVSIVLPEGFADQATEVGGLFMDNKNLKYIYVPRGTDWATKEVAIEGTLNLFYDNTSLPNWRYSNPNDVTNAHIGGQGRTAGYFTDVCELYGTCPTSPDDSAPADTESPQSTTEPNAESPSNVSPLGVTATKISNSDAVVFAIAMTCLFSGTTMMILCIEKVKKDYREENEQF